MDPNDGRDDASNKAFDVRRVVVTLEVLELLLQKKYTKKVKSHTSLSSINCSLTWSKCSRPLHATCWDIVILTSIINIVLPYTTTTFIIFIVTTTIILFNRL